MTKELARYFFTLIDKDLYFSFDGMGLPNNACEWLENQLMQETLIKSKNLYKKDMVNTKTQVSRSVSLGL